MESCLTSESSRVETLRGPRDLYGDPGLSDGKQDSDNYGKSLLATRGCRRIWNSPFYALSHADPAVCNPWEQSQEQVRDDGTYRAFRHMRS
jgi:hypothetical protein